MECLARKQRSNNPSLAWNRCRNDFVQRPVVYTLGTRGPFPWSSPIRRSRHVPLGVDRWAAETVHVRTSVSNCSACHCSGLYDLGCKITWGTLYIYTQRARPIATRKLDASHRFTTPFLKPLLVTGGGISGPDPTRPVRTSLFVFLFFPPPPGAQRFKQHYSQSSVGQ